MYRSLSSQQSRLSLCVVRSVQGGRRSGRGKASERVCWPLAFRERNWAWQTHKAFKQQNGGRFLGQLECFWYKIMLINGKPVKVGLSIESPSTRRESMTCNIISTIQNNLDFPAMYFANSECFPSFVCLTKFVVLVISAGNRSFDKGL